MTFEPVRIGPEALRTSPAGGRGITTIKWFLSPSCSLCTALLLEDGLSDRRWFSIDRATVCKALQRLLIATKLDLGNNHKIMERRNIVG